LKGYILEIVLPFLEVLLMPSEVLLIGEFQE